MRNIKKVLLLMMMPLMANSQVMSFDADTIVKTPPIQTPPAANTQVVKSDTAVNKPTAQPTANEPHHTILLRNGEEITAKLVKVDTYLVQYKKTDNGPIFDINKSDVFMITYKDGTKDVFDQVKKENTTQTQSQAQTRSGEENLSSQELASKGRADAKQFYTASNSGVGAVMLTTTILTPIIGLVPAVLCSTVPPNDKNLNMPYTTYSHSPAYYSSYVNQAIKIKRKKIWTAYGIGCALFIIGIAVF